MLVQIDGTTVYNGPVTTTTLSDVTTSAGVFAAGNHTIAVSFTNDGCASSCSAGDRNLYVDVLNLNP